MRKICGFVLSKQTGKPLSNLQVAFFDSDAEPSTVLGSLDKLDKKSPQERWKLFGRSLGSVLTDAAGRFELDLGNLRQDGDACEQVLLVVFAPDDVANIDKPFPLPPEKRILYISGLPQFDQGGQAYIIRLLPEQLEKFGLAPEGSAPISEPAQDPASRTYADTLERTFVFKDTLKTLVKPRLQTQVAHATEARTAAKKKFASLSAIPAMNRKHPQLLTKPSKLPEMMRKTATAGIAKLAVAPRNLSLSLSAEEVRSLGLKISDDGVVSGQVSAGALAKFLSARNGGVDLIARKPSNLDPLKLITGRTLPAKSAAGNGRKS